MRYANNNEYDGLWSLNRTLGYGIFKEAKTGRFATEFTTMMNTLARGID
jgi:hypothetical protein